MQSYLYQDLYLLEDKHWWHITKRKTIFNLLTKYKQPKRLKILDVGCGTGKNLEFFSKYGRVWGIDNSKEALKFCKMRGFTNVRLAQANKIPFKNSAFDVITLLDVLEHTDDNKVLREIFRILKPDGILIITVPALQWLWSEWDVVLHHKRRYTVKTLNQVLTKNNFKPLKISFMYSYLVFPVLFVRLIKSLIFIKGYPSDFKLSNKVINNVMLLVNQLELKIIQGFGLPFGTSIVCLAKKNEKQE